MALGQIPSFLAVKVPGRMMCRVTGSTRIQSLRIDTRSPSLSVISYTRCMWAALTPSSQVVTSTTCSALGQRWIRRAMRESRNTSRIS